MSTTPYRGIPFIFCRYQNIFSTIKYCAPPVGASPNKNYSSTPLVKTTIPPKKARVYNKSSDTMSKQKLISWASRNKYR